MKRLIEKIFKLYGPLLPDGWEWCTIFYMTDGARNRESTTYGYTNDRSIEELDFDSPTGIPTQVCNLIKDIIDDIVPTPLPRPTHIELTLKPDGEFETVLGYGQPNWDPSPRGWPDDITADEYTYKKAWPNGLKEQTKKRLKDPRSLIGFD